MGDVIGDVNSRRGKIEGMDEVQGNARNTERLFHFLKCLVMQLIYVQEHKVEEHYSMEPSHYEEVPKSVREAIVSCKK